MFNNRQFQIVELLRNKNVSVDEISKIVKKSVRTVMRDLTLINKYFDKRGIGKIVSSKEKSGYELVVKNSLKLDEILKDWVNDDETILYILLTNEYVTIDELSEKLYLSNPIISDKLSVLKDVYKDIINIETTYFGHFINEDNRKKIILISNLIEKNPMYFVKKIGLKENTYNNMIDYFNKNKINICDKYPNINSKQFISIAIAIYHLFKNGENFENESWISNLYIANGLKCSGDMIKNFEAVIQDANNKKRRVTRGMILDILLEIEDTYETTVYDMELVKQLVVHIKRNIAYPYILKQNEIYNISNIKALNPFAFDLSILFSNKLYQEIGISNVNNDLIGLYFICALERLKNSKYKILILAEKISFAIINRQMIESSITNVDIDIISSNGELKDKLLEGNVGLIINNESSLNVYGLNIKVIEVSQIISSKEIKEIKDIIDNLNLKDNIDDIFPRDFSFRYEVKSGALWPEVVEDICLRLKDNNIINEEECTLIVEREKQDNLLVINNIAIPHCISKRKDVCIGIYVKLSKTMKVEGEDVNNLVVMCVDPKKRTNSKIFSYMYKMFNSCKKTLELDNYDNFIKIMKESDYNDRF